MKVIVRASLLMLCVLGVCPPTQAFVLSHFQAPESMIADTEDGSYYVSNINGGPLDTNGSGYISKIDAEGKVVIAKFIQGLNAPKGLVIAGTTLYAADIDAVRGFDKHTGKPVVNVDLADRGAKFLNDIATDDQGSLFVSDMTENRIYRIDTQNDHGVSVIAEGPQLGGPNGLVINPKTKNLIVVTYSSGQVLEIDHAGRVHVLKRSLMNLDGVDFDAALNLYVSSFGKGEIYRITRQGRGQLTTFASGLNTPADISVDRAKNQLLIPSLKGDQVETRALATAF